MVGSSLIMGLGSVSYPWSATSTTGSSFVYLIHWVCRVYPLGSRITTCCIVRIVEDVCN